MGRFFGPENLQKLWNRRCTYDILISKAKKGWSENLKKLKTVLYILIAVIALVYAFVQSPVLNPIYLEGAIFWGVILTAYLLVSTLFKFGEVSFNGMSGTDSPISYTPNERMPRGRVWLIIAPALIIVVVIALSSFVVNWKAYRDQLGEPEVKAFSSDVQAIDINQIPIVDQALATQLAKKKLGERPSLGSQVLTGEPTMQRVDGKLVWVVPLYHSGFFKWITNLDGTPGYIVVSATNVSDVQYVDSYNIKIQPGSFIFQNLKRYTRFFTAPFKGVADYSFEIDDDGNPYWIVTTYHNKRGFNLPEADGIIAIDAQTGEHTRYKMDEIPEWVDRVQPEEFLVNQITNRGKYVHGFLNFSHKDMYAPSAGTTIVYNNDRCYMFTGITSVGQDQSAIGFMMIDMVTKNVVQYQISGATEAAAQASAVNKVPEKGYKASNPIILNIGGHPTFFMTLKDSEELIKQYAFVSVVNYSSVGTGETIDDAMRNYESIMASQSTGTSDIDISSSQKATVEGTVLRIAREISKEENIYKLILNEYPNKIFSIEGSYSNELALTQPGDKVKIEYRSGTGQILTAISFDNLQFTQDDQLLGGDNKTSSSSQAEQPSSSQPESSPSSEPEAPSSAPDENGSSAAA